MDSNTNGAYGVPYGYNGTANGAIGAALGGATGTPLHTGQGAPTGATGGGMMDAGTMAALQAILPVIAKNQASATNKAPQTSGDKTGATSQGAQATKAPQSTPQAAAGKTGQ
jgi:hypothetical protein